MKYQEIKTFYDTGQLLRHYSVGESGNKCGEFRGYYESGQLAQHSCRRAAHAKGEIKRFNRHGEVTSHYLMDGWGNRLATVNFTHSEEELIETAKEHNLPLLSELPKTEEEVTHWNLKWPDCPCLPIESE